MTKAQRVRNVFVGIFMILISIFMMRWPEYGIPAIGGIVTLVLLFRGIKSLHFYFTMSRHMVGGKNSLYAGIILLDLGVFLYTLNSFPPAYIILYLLGMHVFYAVGDILLGIEAKRVGNQSWAYNIMYGVGNLTAALAAMIFGLILGDTKVVVFVYAMGFLYSGIMRILNAFRRSAIVYIQ